jgi:CRP/FNR family transcriptional regulator, anaerobic regulatory protein
MEELFQFLYSIYPMSPELQTHLRTVLKQKTLAKKEFLLKAGRICENVYFVKKGLVRCFYTKDGIDVCSWFMKEGDVVFAVKSFYEQTPSYEAIQALEDCILYYISHKELQNIYKNYIEFNVQRGELTEKYYKLSEERSFSMRMHKSHERYSYLLSNHLELVRRVPLKYIASYIGVSIATMNRLRASAKSK